MSLRPDAVGLYLCPAGCPSSGQSEKGDLQGREAGHKQSPMPPTLRSGPDSTSEPLQSLRCVVTLHARGSAHQSRTAVAGHHGCHSHRVLPPALLDLPPRSRHGSGVRVPGWCGALALARLRGAGSPGRAVARLSWGPSSGRLQLFLGGGTQRPLRGCSSPLRLLLHC